MKAVNLTRKTIEELACKMSTLILYKPECDIEELINNLGGKISYISIFEMVDTNSQSLIVNKPRDFIITIASHTSPDRNRYVFAHELGHYFLHYLYFLTQGQTIGKMCFPRYGDNKCVEREADWFAMELLLPQREFISQYKLYKGNVLELALHFQVLESLIKSRIKRLQL